jgi:hypothetical protein
MGARPAAAPGALLPGDAFSDLPKRLREELLAAFGKIVQNYSERRWEPAELNGGKLCEVAYSIVRGMADGKYPARGSKPRNMVAACQALESETSVPRSVRIQIPRMIVALYEVRNNRNVGHVGGEVDPNHMDAVCVLQVSKWIVAELIRVLHDLPIDEAAELVDALVERQVPIVWEVDGKMRVLDPKMSMKDKALILLHRTAGAISDRDLVAWVEHSNPSVFRRDVLRPAHRARLLEYDRAAETARISPLGIAHVEAMLAERNAL